MERFEGETHLQYCKRLHEAKKNGLINYRQYGELLLSGNNSWSDDNIRKAFYVIDRLLPLIEKDMNYNVTDKQILKEIELQKRELHKELVKVRDQKREIRNNDTSMARFEHLIDEMKESILDTNEMPYREMGSKLIETSMKPTSATLMLSDWHYGAIIDNQFNIYNIETIEDRVSKLYEKTIQHAKTHNVRNLYVEINGDMIHGIIHTGARVESEEDSAKQIVNVSTLLANFLNELKPYFESITTIVTIGNHGRIIPKKTDASPSENFEHIMAEFLRDKLENAKLKELNRCLINGLDTTKAEKEIKIIESGSEDFTKYKIGDKTICVTHGHYDKLNTIVNDFTQMYQEIPTEIHSAHRHSFSDKIEGSTYVVINGSLMGTDSFAVSIRKRGVPSQTMIIYGEDRCSYNLLLD